MTQTNETNSRLDRIEALTLEIATANLRHDRAIDTNTTAISRIDNALEQLTIQNNTAITRHDEAIVQHNEAIARHDKAVAQHDQEMSEIRALQRFNQEQLTNLTAGLLELRTLVANYIQGRSTL